MRFRSCEQPVERRQQRRPAGEGLAEQRRIDSPLAAYPLDHGRLPCLANVQRLDWTSPGHASARCRARSAGAHRAAGATPPRRWTGRRGTRGTRGPTAGRARSGRRPRPRRAAPGSRASSVTLRWWFQPVEVHGFTQVSGSSLEGNGPSVRSRSRMSRRQASLALTQARRYSCQSRSSPVPGHSAISARCSAMSSAGRSVPRSSISACSSMASRSSCREYAVPSRLHITRSALGAIALVGSSCNRESRRTVSSRPVGRSFVSS